MEPSSYMGREQPLQNNPHFQLWSNWFRERARRTKQTKAAQARWGICDHLYVEEW